MSIKPPVQSRPIELWLLVIEWNYRKPSLAKGGGVFRSKADAVARRRLLRRRWPDAVKRASLFRSEVSWQEVPEWWDDAQEATL